jgi:uncharacterized protein
VLNVSGRRCTIAACLLVAVVVCSMSAEGRGESSNASREEKAGALLTALSSGNFDKAGTAFSAKMKEALPPDKLSAVWRQIVSQAGAFGAETGRRSVREQDHDVVIITCRFEKATLDMRAVFENDQIAGLFFTPSQPGR